VPQLCTQHHSVFQPADIELGDEVGLVIQRLVVYLAVVRDQQREQLAIRQCSGITVVARCKRQAGKHVTGERTQATESGFARIGDVMRKLGLVTQGQVVAEDMNGNQQVYTSPWFDCIIPTSSAAQYQLFEVNDTFTQNAFINYVTPLLEVPKGNRGIDDYQVICDSTNNTSQILNSNQFVGDILIKPLHSIRYITLNFTAVAQGVTFTTSAV